MPIQILFTNHNADSIEDPAYFYKLLNYGTVQRHQQLFEQMDQAILEMKNVNKFIYGSYFISNIP